MLEQGWPPDSMLPAFLLRLLTLGGYGPRPGQCLKCGREPPAPLFQVPPGRGPVRRLPPRSPRPLAAAEPGHLEAAAPGPGDRTGKNSPGCASRHSSGTRAWPSSRPFCPTIWAGPEVLVFLGEGEDRGGKGEIGEKGKGLKAVGFPWFADEKVWWGGRPRPPTS